MSFDWQQYLVLAQELAGQQQTLSTEEARLRSAASRAYYGAYCAARNRLEQEGDKTIRSRTDCHTYVWKQFGSSPQRGRKHIAAWGWRLRKARNDADYEDAVANLESTTRKALQESENVFDHLAKLP